MPKSAVLFLLFLTACPRQAPEAPAAPETAVAPEAPDAPDAPPVADLPTAPDAPVGPPVADTPTAPDAPDAPTVTDAPAPPVAPAPAGSTTALVGTRWTLSTIGGADAVAPLPWFQLAADGSLSGHGGCNGMFGRDIAFTDSTVTFGSLGATRMACPNLSEEQAFMRMLSSVTTYRVEGGVLVLLADGAVKARFTAS